MVDPRIRVEDLSYTYSDSGVEVFSGVSFEVNNGDVISLLGPNGTGKSTLLKCLAGVLDCKGGRIFLDGEDVNRMKAEKTAAKMAYVPQTQSSPFPYPVREIVMMGRAPHLGLFSSPGPDDVEICRKAMSRVGIDHLSERPCSRISGGEWQLVLIARAIAQDSGILLLDEPTSHLDLGNQMRILETINNLAASGFTIIVATHFPDHALLTSNRAAVLKDGRLSEVCDPEAIITEKMMAATYGVDVRIMEHESLGERKIIVPMLSKR
jgi:iron complex transport system ATP-binding protein